MSEEITLTYKWRFVAQRLPTRRWWQKWRWAVEEDQGSRGWVLRGEGEALTRRAALDRARRKVEIAHDPDREEQLVVIRETRTVEDPQPTPLPPELLAQGGPR